MQRAPLEELNLQNGPLMQALTNLKQSALGGLVPKSIDCAAVSPPSSSISPQPLGAGTSKESAGASQSDSTASKPSAPKTPLKPAGQISKQGLFPLPLMDLEIGLEYLVSGDTTLTPYTTLWYKESVTSVYTEHEYS